MTQIVYRFTATHKLETLELPDPSEPLLLGIKWGSYTKPFTPAFWRAYLWLHEERYAEPSEQLAKGDVRHETVLCLLGGYGIKGEVAYAYFDKMATTGMLNQDACPTERSISQLLRASATYRGKTYHYRFPNQKARYLAVALARLATEQFPMEDLALRDWLLQLPGVGQKTAGWIVRNCLGSDNVAIIDIHLQRAGRQMRLFDSRTLGASTYAYFERRFLDFARALKVRASLLDLLIWETMRQSALPARLQLR